MPEKSSAYIPQSKTVEWATPQDLFDRINSEFHFTVDVAADDTNHKCSKYYTKESDGLSQDWAGETVWCNPPYGREIADWIKKGFETVRDTRGTTSAVYLVPVRSDTLWWHNYVMPAVGEGWGEIRFIRGRVKFGNATSGAPFPSCLIVFKR